MFKKKAKQQQAQFSYSNWEQDFGFLTLVLARHVNMNKEFYIKTYASQLDNLDTLKEKDLRQAHEDIVYNIYTTFSDNYIRFLVSKYFIKICVEFYFSYLLCYNIFKYKAIKELIYAASNYYIFRQYADSQYQATPGR